MEKNLDFYLIVSKIGYQVLLVNQVSIVHNFEEREEIWLGLSQFITSRFWDSPITLIVHQ